MDADNTIKTRWVVANAENTTGFKREVYPVDVLIVEGNATTNKKINSSGATIGRDTQNQLQINCKKFGTIANKILFKVWKTLTITHFEQAYTEYRAKIGYGYLKTGYLCLFATFQNIGKTKALQALKATI